MRELNKKQKKLLDEWYEKNKELPGLMVFDCGICDAFSGELFEQLEEIFSFEIIYQCINHYIQEKASKEYDEKWG